MVIVQKVVGRTSMMWRTDVHLNPLPWTGRKTRSCWQSGTKVALLSSTTILVFQKRYSLYRTFIIYILGPEVFCIIFAVFRRKAWMSRLMSKKFQKCALIATEGNNLSHNIKFVLHTQCNLTCFKMSCFSTFSYVISAGKSDRAIMIWQVLPMQSSSSTTSTALVQV